jgi:hypothetical protein
MQGYKCIPSFSLEIDEGFPENVVGAPYWTTLIAIEAVPPGYLGHFEILFDDNLASQLTSGMIGAMEGTRTCNSGSYLGRDRNEKAKGIYLSNNSLYTDVINDRGEFSFLGQNVGDKLGIFIDMREFENGRMFLTKNSRLVGQMFKGLKQEMYPAISLCSASRDTAEKIIITNSSTLPEGWNDEMFRRDDYLTTTRKKYIKDNNLPEPNEWWIQ